MSHQQTTEIVCDPCLDKGIERVGVRHEVTINGKTKKVGFCPSHEKRMVAPLLEVLGKIRGPERILRAG